MASKNEPDRDAAAPVVVAITGSAVRTRSLERLLERLPPRGNVALVVVLQQRAALDEERLRAALDTTGHELAEPADGMPVEPGRLYLPGAGVVAALEQGRFQIRPTDQAPREQGLIDSFLVSLASDAGRRGIVIALGGTDGDGTLGVKEMKEAGGMALAEVTEESEADELAHSESPAALADAVLPVDELAARVIALLDQEAGVPDDAVSIAPDAPETRDALATIAAVLRQKTGHDFHGYKPGTFLRRVQRRMQALQADTLPDYIDVLRAQPGEAQDLFNDLLIGVTEFFRDKREWELLEREVVPRLFAHKTAQDQLRVWVVGCSTGEEAYSLAILLAEHCGRLDDPPKIQIFASDLDGRALAAARAGRYRNTVVEQMTPERLGRWFLREGDIYCVAKELREMCVFSQHSLIKDAPFSRIDLVSCRNLLIYLDADLQERVIPLFHFALRPGGFLFLGNSENVSRHQKLFEAVDPRSRIFRRLDTERRLLPDFPLTRVDRRALALTTPSAVAVAPRADASAFTREAERIAERHAPAYVVIDADHNVLHFSDRMGPFITPMRGAASLNLLNLAHPDLRLDLRTALGRAADGSGAVQMGGLSLRQNGHRLAVDLVVEPVREENGPPSGFVVLFKDGMVLPGSSETRGLHLAQDQSELVHRLEEELQLLRGRLQATLEEHESTNEELKASNEEYQSLNEEMQSANEELETSKEELQSINEELTTVNGELDHRVQELGRSNSDLKNFLEATQIPTLFLDNDLRVTNFTPAAVDLFHLIHSDEGRPISHLRPMVEYDDLQDDARRVLRTLVPVEREVRNPSTKAHYMARVLPYRSTDNVIAGVVLTFADVTALRNAERQRGEADAALRESEERTRAIIETATDYAIFTTDPEGRIVTWPKGAELIFGWSAQEAVGQPMDMTYTPEDRAARVPAMERQKARETGYAPNVRWHMRKDGARVFIDGVARPLSGPDGTVIGFVKVGQDVTERRATQEALRESEARFRQFGDASGDVLWIRNAETLEWEYVSPAFEEVYGHPITSIQGSSNVRRWAELIVPEDREIALDHLRQVRDGEHVVSAFRILRGDGEVRWIRDTGFPILDEEGRVQRVAGIGHDATEDVELHDRLRLLVAELQHRSRNLVTVVQAVTHQTLATSETLADFETRIRARLAALGRVNSLLSRLEDGNRITFDQLLHAELQAHGVFDQDSHGGQVRLEGPSGIRLRSATVQTFALAIHELTTNALKYGALSRPEGLLSVRWELVPGEGDERRLWVDWRETGVPVAVPDGATPAADAPAPRRGYGRELIERALPYQLRAKTQYALTPDGVRCTIVVPVSSTLDLAFSS